jgi:hypothetical protein
MRTWYADFDGDGLGDPDSSQTACVRPGDHVENDDDEDPDCTGTRVFYEDQDDDGLGDPSEPTEACSQPDGYVENHDDEEPDCESNDTDECGECSGPGPRPAHPDTDDDGLGDPSVELEVCDLPDGWVRNDDDEEPDCESNDTDECGVCGGNNESRDCAGVCDGEAVEDGCGHCAGGTTGREPDVDDSDEDGYPDACDLCIEPGVGRMMLQWTNIEPFGTIPGGPYTFQILLLESGSFAYLYNDVDPFGNATVTVGHQGDAGSNAVSLAYGSRYPTAHPIVYFRRAPNGTVAVEYNIDVPWQDISTTGTRLSLNDDAHVAVSLPFAFPYDGRSYDSVEVADNGFIVLGGRFPENPWSNQPLPSASIGAMLAVFWDDLDPTSGGSIRYQYEAGSCAADCNGDFGGLAAVDDCGICAGGRTGLVPNAGKDCAGVCLGDATVDVCRLCTGGTTGLEPSKPEDCPNGPDLLVDGQYLRNTIEQDFVDGDEDSCLVTERCVTGPGRRRVVRFGTRIANIGNEDLAIGTPGGSNPLWEWAQCHGHYHYANYANYDLIDVESGMALPIGTKNGFCVLDYEVWDSDLATSGCDNYDCQNQGISVGCADVYDSTLNCQWVDITDVPAGRYDLRVTANPDTGIPELDYTNNSATVRIEISDSDIALVP